jgi:hypothetical protein
MEGRLRDERRVDINEKEGAMHEIDVRMRIMLCGLAFVSPFLL